MDLEALQMKVAHSFEMLGTICPVTGCLLPQNKNTWLACCENFQTRLNVVLSNIYYVI